MAFSSPHPPPLDAESFASIPSARPRRLPLGATRRRISYERRVRLWLTALAVPGLLLFACLVYRETGSIPLTSICSVGFAIVWAIVAAYFFDQLVRPLQTLSNVVSALREDDFSFRARGARRGDSLGDLAFEINALAGTLQNQRLAARDALTLVERIMTSMQSPVLAFGPNRHLRLLNNAAEQTFGLIRRIAIGMTSAELGLAPLLALGDQELYTQTAQAFSGATNLTRWSVRRTTFRLHGIPHTLLVLADVDAALREEERVAWQRLIRVLSHEINNSLTPIKSIAGSLRTRLARVGADRDVGPSDFDRGLTVIEERAASLNNFLQAYQQLTRLPEPHLRRVSLERLIEQIIPLETRLAVDVERGPAVYVQADPDQLQQLLINLICNAVEAASSPDAVAPAGPRVTLSWTVADSQIVLLIRDNSPGLINPGNLFVPSSTTKPNGSGIGLVLARQIAVAHRGSIKLSNQEDAGCTAELRLPLDLL